MEKRKDIDMLRFYGGDIHQKNKEGEYVITNNLVNPKNKEDMLWGDRDAYRTLNALENRCNFLCRWFCVKNDYLIKELVS